MTANPLVRYPAQITFPIVLAVLTLGALAIRWQWTHADFHSTAEAEEVRLFREQLHPAHARVERELEAGNLVNLQRRILGLALHDGITDAWLVDSRPKVVAALARVEVGRTLPFVLTGQNALVRAAVEHRLASLGHDLVVGSIPGELALLGSVGVGKDHHLLVRREFGRTLDLRRQYHQNALLLDAAILIASGAILALLLHFLLFRRSGRLTVALEGLAAGKLDTRIALEGSDELARIGAAVNSMAQRLQLQIEHLAQLGKLIDQSPLVAIAWRNQAGWPVSFVSDNVRQWGYLAQDFLAESFSYGGLIHADDVRRVQEEFDSRLAHGPDEFRQE